MKLLEQKVPVLARFDAAGIRPLTFTWQGRRWAVDSVVRTWRQFALQDEYVHVFLIQTGANLAQLRYFPHRGQWQLDKF